jgi:hypothetical protein
MKYSSLCFSVNSYSSSTPANSSTTGNVLTVCNA